MPRQLQTDRWMFGSTLALCLVGAIMVFSASAVTARDAYGNGSHFLLRQLLWLAFGLGGMMAVMNMDYRKLRRPEVIFTWFLEMRRRPDSFGMNDWKRTILPAIGPVLVLVGLVVLEPDLGTAVEIFIIAVAMLYVAGLNGRYIIGAGLAAIPIIYLLIVRVSYRYERVVAFLNPTADPQGRGFQLLQSLIAVGSGGFTGVGLMESKQKLFYLPEAHTDFIFAVLCEELGFIGGAIVLSLFVVYGWRGMRSAFRITDEFGRFAALGITVMILSQTMINLGVVLGMMPTKGIPLPFISYGGSSLLVMLLATGVLLNISRQAD